jgi:hypothetical protein
VKNQLDKNVCVFQMSLKKKIIKNMLKHTKQKFAQLQTELQERINILQSELTSKQIDFSVSENSQVISKIENYTQLLPLVNECLTFEENAIFVSFSNSSLSSSQDCVAADLLGNLLKQNIAVTVSAFTINISNGEEVTDLLNEDQTAKKEKSLSLEMTPDGFSLSGLTKINLTENSLDMIKNRNHRDFTKTSKDSFISFFEVKCFNQEVDADDEDEAEDDKEGTSSTFLFLDFLTKSEEEDLDLLGEISDVMQISSQIETNFRHPLISFAKIVKALSEGISPSFRSCKLTMLLQPYFMQADKILVFSPSEPVGDFERLISTSFFTMKLPKSFSLGLESNGGFLLLDDEESDEEESSFSDDDDDNDEAEESKVPSGAIKLLEKEMNVMQKRMMREIERLEKLNI